MNDHVPAKGKLLFAFEYINYRIKNWAANGNFALLSELKKREIDHNHSSCLNYSLLSVISIVETILDLLSPSLGGISAVPIAMFFTLRSFMKRFRAISATSTAIVIDWPRAFRVTSFWLLENAVMIAST